MTYVKDNLVLFFYYQNDYLKTLKLAGLCPACLQLDDIDFILAIFFFSVLLFVYSVTTIITVTLSSSLVTLNSRTMAEI